MQKLFSHSYGGIVQQEVTVAANHALTINLLHESFNKNRGFLMSDTELAMKSLSSQNNKMWKRRNKLHLKPGTTYIIHTTLHTNVTKAQLNHKEVT